MKTRYTIKPLFLAVCTILLGGGSFSANSYAAEYFFTGGGNKSLSNGGNWVGDNAPVAGSDWTFENSRITGKSTVHMMTTLWSDQPRVLTVGKIYFNGNIDTWSSNSDLRHFYIEVQRGGTSAMTKDDPLVWTIASIEKYMPNIANFRPKYDSAGRSYVNMVITGDVISDGNQAADSDNSGMLFGGWGPDFLYETTETKETTPLHKLSIGGSLTIGKYERIIFNVGEWSETNYFDASKYDVADVTISGGIKATGNAVNIYMSQFGAGVVRDFYHQTVFHVNGISSGAENNWITIKNRHKEGNALSILVFTNGDGVDTSMNGAIQDAAKAEYKAADNFAKTKVVMNGHANGVQRINGESFFTGGVDVISGKLVFNQTNDKSMGDLLMKGGTFAINSEGLGTHKAVFDNVSYEGGTLQFGLGDVKSDCMILEGVLTNDSLGKIVIDFDLTNIVLDKDYGIMVWSDKGTLTKDDFLCSTDLSGMGIDEVIFDVYDSGLSVKFTSIPEPAAVAVILGIIALSLAVLRRRK